MNPPHTILVIVMRRIGDVLLSTPLIRSLRCAWPKASVDALVFEGTEGILAANPDIRRVLTVREGSPAAVHLQTLRDVCRRYDLALSTQPGDRPTVYAWAAGRKRLGVLEAGPKQWWKRLLLSDWVLFDNVYTHTVTTNLGLAALLGIEKRCEVVVSWKPDDEAHIAGLVPFDPLRVPYAVLHLFPMFPYKQWHREGWLTLCRWLADRGLHVVLTGGPGAEEKAYADAVASSEADRIVNLVGRIDLPGTGALLSRTRLYVGTDTVITHMAAALGVPTVALFGPSNPVKWGPWPKGYCREGSPYVMRGTQRAGNVILLQGNGECVPCREEGCDRHIGSFSRCLLELSADEVIRAVEEGLGAREAAGG
jgi:heptosyltransferase-3